MTLSIGMLVIDPSMHYAEDEIYKYADEALYRAKEQGRNQTVEHQADQDYELF